MAGSLNRAMLIGRLTRDPELKYTQSGKAVCKFGLATDKWQPPDSHDQPTADFHNVVVWNQGNRKLAEHCGQYLQKGRLVYVEGRIETRSWVDNQSGQKRYATDVIAQDVQFLDSQKDQAAPAQDAPQQPAAAAVGNAQYGGDIDPDDIPF